MNLDGLAGELISYQFDVFQSVVVNNNFVFLAFIKICKYVLPLNRCTIDLAVSLSKIKSIGKPLRFFGIKRPR